MAQKTINVGTIANDGTGDTIRGAFTNVNANFTEVFNNVSVLAAAVASIDSGQNAAISSSYTTANAAYDKANAANVLAYSVGVNANLHSISIGEAGNSYAVAIGTAGNSVSTIIGTSANAYSVSIGAAANAYTVEVGAASNTLAIGAITRANTLADAGNSYASILAANNAAGANAWTNTVTVTTYAWANAKFDTVTNTAIIIETTNAAFTKANTALQNTSGTLGGNITITGTVTSTVGFVDTLGPVRERFLVVADANTPILVSHSVVISNSSNNIHIEIPNDNVFLSPANIGSSIYIYQYGTGVTKIVAQTASVTVHSSNNWANIAGQYLTATAVKVLPNTWILTGDLKP